MNTYKDTFELYRSVFDEVHASDELLRKVENMSQNKPAKKYKIVKRVALIAAVIAALFVASNAIAYAATGSTWVEQIAVHVVVNGENQDVNMTKTVDEDGNTSYEMELKDGDAKHGIAFRIDGDEQINDGDTLEMEMVGDTPTITEENGRIYFELPSLDIRQDITEDFADGKAEIIAADQDGHQLTITVEGTIDEYSVEYFADGKPVGDSLTESASK